MSTLATRLKINGIDRLFWSMLGLSLAGIGVSLYLMWGYTVPGATLSCGASSGCETVKESVYANPLGIPMPLLGLLAYGAVLGLLFLQRRFAAGAAQWSAYAALAIFGISLAGVLYSAYLTYLELFVIQAICRWCVASAIIMGGVFILAIPNLSGEKEQ